MVKPHRRFGTASSQGMLFDHAQILFSSPQGLRVLPGRSQPATALCSRVAAFTVRARFLPLFRQKSLRMSVLGRMVCWVFFPLVAFASAFERQPGCLHRFI